MILDMTARSVGNQLRTPNLPIILNFVRSETQEAAQETLEAYADQNSFRTLTENLKWQCENFRLSDITLLTTGALVVADANKTQQPGELCNFAQLDHDAIDAAAHGQPAAIEYYRVKDQFYRRFYLPLEENGEVCGVLMLSIRIPYIAELRVIRTQAVVQSALGSLILLVLAISVHRLFRRAVKAEEAAMQSARNEAIGAMSAGIAHEIRNPLAAIRAMAEEADEPQCPPAQREQNISDILAETLRLADITDHFLALARHPETSTHNVLDLRDEWTNVIRLVEKSTPENTRITTDFPLTPTPILGNGKALQQAFLNLLLNAAQAMPATGGNITVTIRRKRNETVELTIKDTGSGIPQRIQNRIFEPFFTTKPNGTGLGLSLTRALLESMNATLDIVSEEGTGTTVNIIFPAGK